MGNPDLRHPGARARRRGYRRLPGSRAAPAGGATGAIRIQRARPGADWRGGLEHSGSQPLDRDLGQGRYLPFARYTHRRPGAGEAHGDVMLAVASSAKQLSLESAAGHTQQAQLASRSLDTAKARIAATYAAAQNNAAAWQAKTVQPLLDTIAREKSAAGA